MKTLLNLLPEEKKAAIQRRLHFRFLLWQVFLLFLLECFYLSVLLGIYFILSFQLDNYQSLGTSANVSSYAQEKTLTEYERKFRDTNDAVETVGKIERSHLHFTEVFLLLDELLPDGIRIGRLSTKDYTVMLSGTAAKRDDLLALDERLKGAACIADVNIPISNLFSQENVGFQIDFSVKTECLRK
jgi:hypothetical protein